jgi:hypothetical protein
MTDEQRNAMFSTLHEDIISIFERSYYYILTVPINELPLYINHTDKIIAKIASYRLKNRI